MIYQLDYTWLLFMYDVHNKSFKTDKKLNSIFLIFEQYYLEIFVYM